MERSDGDARKSRLYGAWQSNLSQVVVFVLERERGLLASHQPLSLDVTVFNLRFYFFFLRRLFLNFDFFFICLFGFSTPPLGFVITEVVRNCGISLFSMRLSLFWFVNLHFSVFCVLDLDLV